MCGLGFIGNVSSLFVLLRHQKDIAGSRPLLALTAADLGVVLSIAWRTIAYYTTVYSQQTLTAEWICLYWYYCSVYFTILLSVDRYLSSAYPMLLLKINYTNLQGRIIGTVFPAVFLITQPHLLGFIVTCHHGSHNMAVYCYHKDQICNLLSHRTPDKDVPWTVMQCGNISDSQVLTTSEAFRLEYILQLLDTWSHTVTLPQRTTAPCVNLSVHQLINLRPTLLLVSACHRPWIPMARGSTSGLSSQSVTVVHLQV